MDYASFDLRAFVESLDLRVGLFRLVRTETTDSPNIVVAMTQPNMFPEQLAQLSGNIDDMVMPVWVTWIGERGILRLHCNLDLGTDSIGDERLEFLVKAANHLNCWTWDRICKAFVHKSEDEEVNIGTAAFALFVPPPLMQTPEGLEALKVIVAANLARLAQEAATTSIDFHNALATNDMLPEEAGGESLAKN